MTGLRGTGARSSPVADVRAHAGLQVQLSVRRGREAAGFYLAVCGAVGVYRSGVLEATGDIVGQLVVGETLFWVEDESPPHHNFCPESLGGVLAGLLPVADEPHSAVERAV